ncbi:extracellular solute-binding protein [Candidatus Gracilibacteria bacterium]|nr:extracellular solute-binding protein [Candidatus Gracilibacteria bacterium]
MKKVLANISLLAILAMPLSGCSLFLKEKAQKKGAVEQMTLNYYRFGDDAEVIKPLLDSYQTAHPGLTIRLFTQFPSYAQYEDQIINEMAEGGGPDLFSAPNAWIYKHQKKIAPLPTDMMSVDQFRQTFVAVADRDLVRPDGGTPAALRIYGIPLFIDTLALYFNKKQYEDRLPSKGGPSVMWKDFAQDATTLTKSDNSPERFEVAGAALGRVDNVRNGLDVLYSLFLQYGVSFYNPQGSATTLSSAQSLADDNSGNPFLTSLQFFTNFAVSSSSQYSWNQYMATANGDKEITPFAKGKVSTIAGYSSDYAKIAAMSDALSRQGYKALTPKDIGVAPLPQVHDPAVSANARSVLASYMFETVSRNSTHQKQAWDLLQFLSNQQNSTYYHQKTHRPTSRRDLLDTQAAEPIYGVFAKQVGFASSMPLYDIQAFNTIFSDAVQGVADGLTSPVAAFKTADMNLGQILPQKGFVGPGPHVLVTK